MFANPLESTQKVAQLSPKPFDGVGVNFVYAVSVVISRPLLDAMAYRSVIKYLCANMIVSIAFVTVTGSCITSVRSKRFFNLPLSSVSQNL